MTVKLFGAFGFVGGNVLYHSEDNGPLTHSGTYVDPIQDVTV